MGSPIRDYWSMSSSIFIPKSSHNSVIQQRMEIQKQFTQLTVKWRIQLTPHRSHSKLTYQIKFALTFVSIVIHQKYPQKGKKSLSIFTLFSDSEFQLEEEVAPDVWMFSQKGGRETALEWRRDVRVVLECHQWSAGPWKAGQWSLAAETVLSSSQQTKTRISPSHVKHQSVTLREATPKVLGLAFTALPPLHNQVKGQVHGQSPPFFKVLANITGFQERRRMGKPTANYLTTAHLREKQANTGHRETDSSLRDPVSLRSLWTPESRETKDHSPKTVSHQEPSEKAHS